MSNNVIIAGIVGLLVAGAGVAFVALSGDDADSNDSNSAASSQTINTQSEENDVDAGSKQLENALGLDTTTLEGPYRLTLSTVGVDGRTTEGIVDVDSMGNFQTTVTDNGITNSVIYHDEITYSQNPDDGSWIKFPAEPGSGSLTDELNLGFSQEDVDGINNSEIDDKGKGDCTAGTCRIYEVTDAETGDFAIVKVDDDSNRLSDLDITEPNGAKTIVSYDYSIGVEVTAPENAIDFTLPNLNPESGLEDVDIDALLESIPQN